MKLLTFLGVAQTALILILLIKVIDLGRGAGIVSASDPVPGEIVALPVAKIQPANSTRPLDEGRLRIVIREELAALLNSSAVTAEGPEPVGAAEYQYRLEAALHNLDDYIERGEISDMEMAKFQSEIAGLDDEGRRQMLSLLTQALNSGELEGHF